MPTATEQATALVQALNEWAYIDISLAPAAVTACNAKSLPKDPKAARTLIDKAHRAFLDEVIEHGGSVDFGDAVLRNVVDFDPTESCGYAPPPEDALSVKAEAAAKGFFTGRKVDVVEAYGADSGAYEFEFDLVIALDAANGLIFSFIWNLED
jgi:hypothetical protein